MSHLQLVHAQTDVKPEERKTFKDCMPQRIRLEMPKWKDMYKSEQARLRDFSIATGYTCYDYRKDKWAKTPMITGVFLWQFPQGRAGLVGGFPYKFDGKTSIVDLGIYRLLYPGKINVVQPFGEDRSKETFMILGVVEAPVDSIHAWFQMEYRAITGKKQKFFP
ncbi:MAG: hypothetical protein LBO00_08890 [Zoogloeaceae bacterium]|jgi:hypothetical protein|nr:hypothetical protein [Zoogloeaceae bacterium]